MSTVLVSICRHCIWCNVVKDTFLASSCLLQDTAVPFCHTSTYTAGAIHIYTVLCSHQNCHATWPQWNHVVSALNMEQSPQSLWQTKAQPGWCFSCSSCYCCCEYPEPAAMRHRYQSHGWLTDTILSPDSECDRTFAPIWHLSPPQKKTVGMEICPMVPVGVDMVGIWQWWWFWGQTYCNTIISIVDDTRHLVDTSACTCGDKGGLLQLSSLGYFRTTVTTAAVCL